MRRRWTAITALLVVLAASAASAVARDRLDVGLFARVSDPGSPEGIAVNSKGGVFVGTSPKKGGMTGQKRRSKVFVYDRRGQLQRAILIRGQDLEEPFYGLLGMAFDGRDRLFIADGAPPRIVLLNPRTGVQRTYARFRDVPPCDSVGREGNCSETVLDMTPFPDYPVFAPNGAMYVTDLNQGLIWRLPRGGGKPKIWFTEAGFESLFGPNGIQFVDRGRTLLFVLSTEGNPAASRSGPPASTRSGCGGAGGQEGPGCSGGPVRRMFRTASQSPTRAMSTSRWPAPTAMPSP